MDAAEADCASDCSRPHASISRGEDRLISGAVGVLERLGRLLELARVVLSHGAVLRGWR